MNEPEPAILIGGPHDGRQLTGTRARIIETVFVTPGYDPWRPPRPAWWRHPIGWYRWQPPPPPRLPEVTQLRYEADGTTSGGRRVFRLVSPWQPYRGPDVGTDQPLYNALVNAMYAVPPQIRQDLAARWVMNEDWWKKTRREAVRLGYGGDDEDSWKPAPDDCLLGMKINVTDDSGAPHLENQRYPQGWPGKP